MIKLPPNNQWSQSNDSDKAGSLYTSFNLDLTSNKGATRLSSRTVITTDDITDLGVPIGFARFNSTSLGYWTVAGSYVFKTSIANPSEAFVKDAQTRTPTTCSSDTSDIAFFKKSNKLVVSTQTDIYYNSGAGSWDDITGTPFTSGSPHMFAEYGNLLYVTDEFKKIYSLDTSLNLTTSGANTFSLGTYTSTNVGLFITNILSSSDGIWILTATQQFGEFGEIIKWDGAQENNPSARYILDNGGALAGVVKDDALYILNTDAELLAFNGGSFVRIPNGRLPVNKNKFLKNSFSSINNRWIHPNGMNITNDGKINILINNEYEDGTIEENMASGIWEFDTQNISLGWYHKNSLSLYTSTITDYGQNRVSRVGGLYNAKTPNKQGTFLAGAQIYSDATNTKEVILTNDTADTIQKYGYLVTSWIFSNQIKDTWQKLIIRLSRLLSATDKIVVKYRLRKTEANEISVTWYNGGSVFKTSADISDYSVGDEIEVTQGKGGGQTAHISTINDLGGGITEVELDETFEGVDSVSTSKVRIQKWVKSSALISQEEDFYKFPIDEASTKIQLKICAKFTGDNEVDDFILVNETQTKVE